MIKFILFLMAVLLLTSCEKIIDVDLVDVAPRVVIEGNITSEAGPYFVRISESVSFSSSSQFKGIAGATVTFFDETSGVKEVLLEETAGIHRSRMFVGIPGHIYRMDVSLNGENYSGRSAMPFKVFLDSVTFRRSSRLGASRIFAQPNFQDPAGIANQYLFTQYINGKQFTQSLFVVEDRLSDGRNITQPLIMDSAFIAAGDSVLIEMKTIDRPVYEYFNTFQNVISGSESASPANPVSNLSGNVLGYFSASTVDRKGAVAR